MTHNPILIDFRGARTPAECVQRVPKTLDHTQEDELFAVINYVVRSGIDLSNVLIQMQEQPDILIFNSATNSLSAMEVTQYFPSEANRDLAFRLLRRKRELVDCVTVELEQRRLMQKWDISFVDYYDDPNIKVGFPVVSELEARANADKDLENALKSYHKKPQVMASDLANQVLIHSTRTVHRSQLGDLDQIFESVTRVDATSSKAEESIGGRCFNIDPVALKDRVQKKTQSAANYKNLSIVIDGVSYTTNAIDLLVYTVAYLQIGLVELEPCQLRGTKGPHPFKRIYFMPGWGELKTIFTRSGVQWIWWRLRTLFS